VITFIGNGQNLLYLQDILDLISLLPPKTWKIVVKVATIIKEEGLT
jgi:hypothetical protein